MTKLTQQNGANAMTIETLTDEQSELAVRLSVAAHSWARPDALDGRDPATEVALLLDVLNELHARSARIAELEAALRRITPAYRAACAQLAEQSGDSEFWDSDAEILAECERLIAQ